MDRRAVFAVLVSVAVACRSVPRLEFRPPQIAGASFERINAQGYPVYRRAVDGMPMVLIGGGTFRVKVQGSEIAWHLPEYAIDEHEVTNRQFLEFLRQAPAGEYTTEACLARRGSAPDLPVVGVTEYGARAYAAWVKAELPSLAHFEKAAAGSIPVPQNVPVDQAAPIGRYGVRGLYGNVAEICLEEYKDPACARVVMGGSWQTGPVEPMSPSHSADALGTAEVGFRCVLERPIPRLFRIEWRRDLWQALEEGRRRNAIVFATFHWDGCGACDRYRDRVLTDPRIVEFLNERAVPAIGHGTQDFCEGHAPLPNGDCWVYTGLKCADHHEIFGRGPGSLMDFGGSPGHYLLKYPDAAVPDKKDFIFYDDRRHARQDSVEAWLRIYEQAQKEMGPALTRAEYAAQQTEFEILVESYALGRPDEARIRSIASDPRAAFRREASVLVSELSKAAEWIEGDGGLGDIEQDIGRGDYARALAALRAPPGGKDPRALRRFELRQWIDRTAWQRLIDARMLAGPHRDAAGAKRIYAEIIERFPGTAVQESARKELEALP